MSTSSKLLNVQAGRIMVIGGALLFIAAALNIGPYDLVPTGVTALILAAIGLGILWRRR